MTTLSAYNGRAFLGLIRERGPTAFEAIAPDGRSLGRFPTRREALAALPSPAAPSSGRRS